MIHNEVDEKRNVKIRFGDLATLVANSGGLGSNPEFVDAIYLGHTPQARKLQGFCSSGEGHLFARLGKRGELFFYLAHNLKMEYWSDGDDDPSYAVGINAWKTDGVEMNFSERDYVFSLIKKRNMQL